LNIHLNAESSRKFTMRKIFYL